MSFPDFETEYRSVALFPLFANRVMPHSRPDYPDYVKWLQLESRQKDPMAFLANSGGQRATDTLEVISTPTLCTIDFKQGAHIAPFSSEIF